MMIILEYSDIKKPIKGRNIMKTQETKNLLGNQNTQKAISRTLKRIIEHIKMVNACRTLKGYIIYDLVKYTIAFECWCITSCICLFWFSCMYFFLLRGKPASMDNPIWQSRPYKKL